MTIALHAVGDTGYRAPRTADVILYLDIDGVVHHHAVQWHHKSGFYLDPVQTPGRQLFEWVPLLLEALRPFPHVRLVLSSGWCIRPGYGKTLKRLPDDLRARVVGGTYHRRVQGLDRWAVETFQMQSRVEQILADVARRKPSRWLALDDDVVGWPHRHLGNLVACNGETGISDERVRAELAHKLQACVSTTGHEVAAHEEVGQCAGHPAQGT